MPNMGTVGPGKLKSRARQCCLAEISGTVNDVANFATLVDHGKILSQSTPPAYVAVGIQRFTLRERWKRINCTAFIASDATKEVMPVAITCGDDNPNVVDILCHVATVPAAYTNADRIMVVNFYLER